MGKNNRVVKALLATIQVKVGCRVHWTARLLEPHFRLIAAVVGRVYRQCISWVVEGRSAGTIDVKVSPAAASGKKIRPAVGEISDIGVSRVDGKRNNAIGKNHVGSVLSYGYVRSCTCSTARHISEREGRKTNKND